MSDRREQLAGMSIAFVVGAALGAGVALLLAPASGAETRRKIREASEKAYESGKEKMHEVMVKARHLRCHGDESEA